MARCWDENAYMYGFTTATQCMRDSTQGRGIDPMTMSTQGHLAAQHDNPSDLTPTTLNNRNSY